MFIKARDRDTGFIAGVGALFESALAKIMDPAVYVLAKVAGLDTIVRKVSRAIESLPEKSMELVQAGAKAVAAPFKSLMDKLLSALGLGDKKLLTVPVESDGKSGKDKVTVAIAEGGTVFVGTSPAKRYEDEYIEGRIKLERRAEGKRLKDKVVAQSSPAKAETTTLKGKAKQTKGYKNEVTAGTPETEKLVSDELALAEFLEKNLINHCEEHVPPFKYQSTAPSGYDSWTDYVVKKCGGSTEGITNPHGHHIVMKGDRYAENEESRQILCKHNIDPFVGCENLVVARNWCHSQQYATATLAALKEADKRGRNAVIQALSSLAKAFSKCEFGGEEFKVNEDTDEL